MRQVPKRLLIRYLHQFSSDEDKEQAKNDFTAAWRSARIVLDTLDAELETQLGKLIKADESITNTEIPQPDIKHWYNLGLRANCRWVLNQLLSNDELHTGDK